MEQRLIELEVLPEEADRSDLSPHSRASIPCRTLQNKQNQTHKHTLQETNHTNLSPRSLELVFYAEFY